MDKELANINNIQNYIYTIRGLQVMFDNNLADLYGVEVKRLNEQVRRNIERFPEKFRFQLTDEEYSPLRFQNSTLNNIKNLKSQIATSSSNTHGGRRKLPYVFTEQGVSMLSTVLRSETAIKVSIQIMDAFINMCKFISNNAAIFQRLDKVEQRQLITDTKLDKVFEAIEANEIKPKQGIFFDGQIFDAYKFVSNLIRSAKKSIVLIDNYIDDTVLIHFEKRKKNVLFTILTKNISKKLKLDIEKFNQQYPAVNIKEFKNAHDRFLIIDRTAIYHFGASLKDLGKKWFAFSKMDMGSFKILEKVEELI